MAYDALVDRLATDDRERRVVAFPDGSVDVYYSAFDGEGERIDDRETFGDRIARGDHDSFPVAVDSREPGGQAVGMARQTEALGDETTLYGHLEDPVFTDLPFETVSMGDPSRISIFSFADDDLLLSETATDVETWSLGDLRATSSCGDVREALAAEAICCGNWASLGGLTDALSTLADGVLEADVFVLDPGAVSTSSHEAVADLLEALGDLDARLDVLLSVNRTELEYTVDAIATTDAIGNESNTTDENDDLESLASVREAAGITAVVLHETDIAAAATRDDETVVENLTVEEPRRRTGAGDRFSAGLAVGRARDWDWDVTLALGNCCATYYVETAETGDRSDLVAFLEENSAI